MGLETAPFINGLVATNPVGGTDSKSEGDDHLRLIKAAIKATFPNITGAMTLTHTQMNALWARNIIAGDGLTGGGALDADRTIAIGAPSTLTLLTTNAVTADSHTHDVEIPDAVAGVAGLLSIADKAILDAITANTSAFVTGDFKWSAVKAAPTGWLIANGLTIGNASSGGTARANADTVNLFTVLWVNYADAQLPIFTSAGGASSRGGSAAADFAANKRISLPDVSERVMAGWDNLATKSRMTAATQNGDTFGGAGGFETHALITGELAVHSHGPGTLATDTHGGHTHGYSATVFNSQTVTGPGAAQIWNAFQASTTGSGGAHAHGVNSGATANAGSGAAHNNLQPTIIANCLIKL